VGIQLVGPVRAERRLLELAHAFEQLTRVGDRRPDLAVAETTGVDVEKHGRCSTYVRDSEPHYRKD
jgi:hypothetical protein